MWTLETITSTISYPHTGEVLQTGVHIQDLERAVAHWAWMYMLHPSSIVVTRVTTTEPYTMPEMSPIPEGYAYVQGHLKPVDAQGVSVY